MIRGHLEDSRSVDALRTRLPPARLLNWCLWGIIIALVFPMLLKLAIDDPVDYPNGGIGAADFKAYYIAARLMARGEDIYDVQRQTHEMDALGLPRDGTLYIYPSALAVVLMPLTNLALPDAAGMWNLMNLVLIGATLILVSEALDLRRVLKAHFPWLIILFCIAAPTIQSLRIGQANILVLFLLALAFHALKHDHQSRGGLALGAATLIKVFPAGLIAWILWKRQYRLRPGQSGRSAA
jgi:Glycosyltransferase family 87